MILSLHFLGCNSFLLISLRSLFCIKPSTMIFSSYDSSYGVRVSVYSACIFASYVHLSSFIFPGCVAHQTDPPYAISFVQVELLVYTHTYLFNLPIPSYLRVFSSTHSFQSRVDNLSTRDTSNKMGNVYYVTNRFLTMIQGPNEFTWSGSN